MFDKNHQKNTRVLAIANQKGGVGKTANSIHLAAGFAELGKTSLIIDLDASAGATKLLGAPLVGWNTTYEFVTGEVDAFDTIITDKDEEIDLPKNIHLIPSSSKLDQIDTFLSSPENLGIIQQDILVKPISGLRGWYDYIILDSPPLITKFTFPALKASDYVILSTQPEKLSVEALTTASNLIASAKEHGNPNVRLLGIVINTVPNPLTRLARHFIGEVDKTCIDSTGKSLSFENRIERNVAIQEAGALKQNLFEYEPNHKATNQYRSLVKEVGRRIKKIERENNKKSRSVVNG